MKRYFLLISFLLFRIISSATEITWVGDSGENWNTASNWLPASVPTSSDDVVFNTSVTVNMDVLSSTAYSINSLKITSNVTVILQRVQSGGGDRVLKLLSTDPNTKGLQIDAGCILIIHGKNTDTGSSELGYILDLSGASGVTGEIAGELRFTGAESTSTDHGTRLRLYTDPSNYANLFVKNGGIIRYLPLTGNTSSNTSGTFLTMESGSQYVIEKNGGSFPSGGSWDQNSLAKVENLSGANGATFNGTDYGNIDWKCPAQTTVAYLNKNVSFNNVNLISTGSNNSPNAGSFRIKTGASTGTWTMTINGNLTIGTNSEISTTSINTPSGSGGILFVKGHILNQGVITTYGVTGTVNEISLEGTVNQNISSSGTISGTLLNFKINNPAGATLNTPLTLPFNLALTSGKITTTSVNLLSMVDGAIYTGGSSSSFIDGPMKKIGDDDFIFPVGKGSIYAPIGIAAGGGESGTDVFIAEYHRINPQSIHGGCTLHCDPSLNHVSFVEYWDLGQYDGSSTKKVSLEVHALSFCKMLNYTYVSMWDGAKWTNEPTVILAGPNVCGSGLQCGTIQASNPTNAFGKFTLATDQSFINNPLPVHLLRFTAKRLGSNTSVIEWEMTDFCSSQAEFVVEKSVDGQTFNALATQPGNEQSMHYFYTDTHFGNRSTWYRLKMIGSDGRIAQSGAVALMHTSRDIHITSISPNPVQQQTQLFLVSGVPAQARFTITDMSGLVLQQWSAALAAGSNKCTIDLKGLPAGIYNLTVQTANSSSAARFVKQ